MIHKEGTVVYPEVEALSVLMGYKTANAGCCKVRPVFLLRRAGSHYSHVCTLLPGFAAPRVGQRSVPGDYVYQCPPHATDKGH